MAVTRPDPVLMRKQRDVAVRQLTAILRLTYHDDMPEHLADVIRPLCTHPGDNQKVRAMRKATHQPTSSAMGWRAG